MSGWEQQMFNEQRRWHEESERRLQKMERDVERGRDLIAELDAAKRRKLESELEHERG